MSEDHKKQLNILGEIRDQIKRLADLAKPTRIIFAKKPTSPDANIRLEILEKAFLHDTGIVAPHKIQRADTVSSGHSIEERQDAWHKWLKENDVPPPADDALVEAVKTFLGDEICGGYEMPTWDIPSVTLLRNALQAAHKQAGGK